MKFVPEVASDFRELENILCEPHYAPSFEGTMFLPCDIWQFCELAEQVLKTG